MGNSPNNLTILRHMALNVMRKQNAIKGPCRKFKRAGWDDDYLTKLLALFWNGLPCHMTVNLLQVPKDKHSLEIRQKLAAWDAA